MVIGDKVGMILLDTTVIQPGSSKRKASAAVGAVGGGFGWLIGNVAAMFACRRRPPADWVEATGLAIAAVGIICAAAMLAAFMDSLQDRFDDPRMFRLNVLIWLDASIAAVTCLLVAQRRWEPALVIRAMLVVGAAAFAVSQLLPFFAECAPLRNGSCRVGF